MKIKQKDYLKTTATKNKNLTEYKQTIQIKTINNVNIFFLTGKLLTKVKWDRILH